MSETKTCEAPGCSKSTREKKPFCSDHVEMHPYVQELLKAVADQTAEQKKVDQKISAQHVPADSLTVQEIINHIKVHGSRTVERLARELNFEVELIHRYVNTLISRGVLKIGRTKRGSTIVSLVDERGDDPVRTGTDS